MIRTHVFRCALPKAEADALNHESGRVYTGTLVRPYRIYRKSKHWLSMYAGKRVEDGVGGPTTLHAHSRDAAQEGFYKACRTTKALKQAGLTDARYPHKRKWFRTSVWKRAGIRAKDGALVLARARGLAPVRVALPAPLVSVPRRHSPRYASCGKKPRATTPGTSWWTMALSRHRRQPQG